MGILIRERERPRPLRGAPILEGLCDQFDETSSSGRQRVIDPPQSDGKDRGGEALTDRHQDLRPMRKKGRVQRAWRAHGEFTSRESKRGKCGARRDS